MWSAENTADVEPPSSRQREQRARPYGGHRMWSAESTADEEPPSSRTNGADLLDIWLEASSTKGARGSTDGGHRTEW